MQDIQAIATEAAARLKRKNQVLFSKNSACLQPLALMLADTDHRTAVLWALDLAAQTVSALGESYPDEARPSLALEAAWSWARGEIRMREAQRRILDCHALAKELDDRADRALCHAVGQACSVVHTTGHALGYPVYELTAIVLKEGAGAVVRRIGEYQDLLLYWKGREPDDSFVWAGFLGQDA